MNDDLNQNPQNSSQPPQSNLSQISYNTSPGTGAGFGGAGSVVPEPTLTPPVPASIPPEPADTPFTPTAEPVPAAAPPAATSASVSSPVVSAGGGWRKRLIWTFAIALLALILGAAGFGWYRSRQARTNQAAAELSADQFGNTDVQLSGLTGLTTDGSQQLAINGQLLAHNTLVLSPLGQPTDPVLGQIYLNSSDNRLYYFNGQLFVPLATGSIPSAVNSIGGISGTLVLGPGLGASGNQLSNTGVLSLTGTANQVLLSSATGDITVSLPQDIAPGSSPTFAGLNLNAPLAVSSGGTGLAATPSSGQLLIGNGAGYTLNTLTAGSGVTIDNAAGSITISAPGSGSCSSCANTSLSNLSSVAINAALLPGSNNTIDLGSAALGFRDLFIVGQSLFRNDANSTTAFRIQNAGGVGTIFNVDTTNSRVTVTSLEATGDVDFADAAAGDTIDIGDSLAATQDTVNIQGNINIGTDSDADLINIGTANDTSTILGDVSIGQDATAKNIIIGDNTEVDLFSLNSSGLDIGSDGRLFDVGTDIFAAAGLTISTAGANNLILDSGSNIVQIAASDTLDVNGIIRTTTLGSGGTESICRNASNELATCGVGSSAATLQSAYDNGNTISTTNARDIAITLADSVTTDANLLVNIATGSTGRLAVQANGTDTFSIDGSGLVVATGNLDFADAASGDTIDIGDSLSGGQDTVNIQGNINIGTDTDVDVIAIGGNSGDTTTIFGNTSIGTSIGFAETILVGDLGDTFSLSSTGLRISTTGSLTNVGTNITAGAAVTIASSGAGNDVIINGADILDVQDAATFASTVTITNTLTANSNVDFADAAINDTIDIGDSTGAGQDTVNIQGNVNIATDSDADNVLIGSGTGDSVTISAGSIGIGGAGGSVETINIGDIGDPFSLNSTGLRVSTTGSLTNVGTNITAAADLTVASSGSGQLTLGSANGVLDLTAATAGIRALSGDFYLNLLDAAASHTFSIVNFADFHEAHLDVEGGINIGPGQTYKINGSPISSSALSDDANIAKLDGTGPQTFTGNNQFNGTLVHQPAASLTDGQIAFTQTISTANTTASGTTRGYQLNFDTSSNTQFTTNRASEINVTDNASAMSQDNYGLRINMTGTNTSQSQIGAEINVNRGIALRAVSTGQTGNSESCGSLNSSTLSVGLCAYGNAARGTGVYGQSSGSSSGSLALGSHEGAGVYGTNQSAGTASNFYHGVVGQAFQSASAGYTSIGVYGNATGGTGSTAYGGYFELGAGAPHSGGGSAIYGSNGTSSAGIIRLQDNATTVFEILNGGALTARNQTNSTTAFQIQNSSSATIFDVDSTNQRVGVGTSSPQALLHVSRDTTDALFRVTDATATAVDVLNIADEGATTFKNRTNSTGAFQVQDTAGTSILTVNTTDLRVEIASGADIKLLGAGNTRNAITKDFTCTSSEAVNDIVAVTGSATVGRTTTAASNRVAGVVVAKPNSTTCTTAIAGMVQVWFSTNGAPGTIGDPIETSTTTGAAQSTTTPAAGAVLGKSTSTKDGSDLVWVLLKDG